MCNSRPNDAEGYGAPFMPCRCNTSSQGLIGASPGIQTRGMVAADKFHFIANVPLQNDSDAAKAGSPKTYLALYCRPLCASHVMRVMRALPTEICRNQGSLDCQSHAWNYGLGLDSR